MNLIIILTTAGIAGWLIDRLAFDGDFARMVRDEISLIKARHSRR